MLAQLCLTRNKSRVISTEIWVLTYKHGRMESFMKVLLLLKGKLLLTVIASVVLVAGGATAVFASTSAGQSVVQSMTHGKSSATAGAAHTPDHDPSKTPEGKKNSNDCSGLADAQNLATTFH